MQKTRKSFSLFSGAGGLDIGIRQAGFSVAACVEFDKYAAETLRFNCDRLSGSFLPNLVVFRGITYDSN